MGREEFENFPESRVELDGCPRCSRDGDAVAKAIDVGVDVVSVGVGVGTRVVVVAAVGVTIAIGGVLLSPAK
jgi:hypothetical protein